ncbi:MAG TPA: hypothetical protein VLB80_03865 [Candidatus Babeliales bacterium]|nr:hypothetical protein [Candidatus Babeliales bacterium]
MTLIQSWIDSLTLFKPKNAQLFVLVTIKSIIEAYKLMLYYFWWVLLLIVLCLIAPYLFSRTDLILYCSNWLYELLFLMVCFSTRPSMMPKNGNYFEFQLKKIALYWIFMPLFSWSSATYYGYIFTVLFFADSSGGLKNFLLSLWNALRMIFFNLPLIVTIGMMLYGLSWMSSHIIEQVFVKYNIMGHHQFLLFLNMIGAFLLPVGVCIYTNIYIKKLHDQFDSYFQKF